MKKALLALCLLLAPTAVLAQDMTPKVQVRLVAEDMAVAPGSSITVALVQNIREGWHTYWLNPGDAGAATNIKWNLPAGWTAGAIQWPTPKRLPVGPLMDYGYEGQPWLLQTLTVPADAKVGTRVMLRANADWLVCRDICVPEEGEVMVPVTIGTAMPNPVVKSDFAAARAKLPAPSPWKMNYALSADGLDLYAAAPQLAAAHPKEADFFPAGNAVIKGAVPQKMGFTNGGLVVRLAPGAKAASMTTLTGVLVLTSSDGSVQALTVDAPKGVVPAADFGGAAAPDAGAITLWLALVLAFAGGIILNAMPCVLPVLAMKALALAGHGAGEKREAAREGFAYSAGAILSFLAFGLGIVLLRQGGAAVGWGFQLQEPIAVAGFALLIFAVALNLSGVFEVGTVTAGDSLAQRGGPTGAFFTGVLAVAVAAPCTAPFMAAALGFALTLAVAPAMLIFLALGIGFALPFLLLGIWPRALSFLPRPGHWMLKLKQFLAFPMYGAAAWMVWVLAQESGANGVALVLAAMVALAMAAWLWTVTRDLETRGRMIGLLAALLILLTGLYGVSLLKTVAAAPSATTTAEAFTPEKLASLRASGKPVFVDATAAWCITCLVNEQAVLSRDNVKAAFADGKVTYLVADWTNRNSAITKMLEENGRSGVPLYLYYAPGAQKPVILPQILTEDGVLAALKAPA